jgi:peptide deformylase
MQIVHYPHPALRWKSKPVTEINAELRADVARMFELMYEAKGVGLAANQVALPYRLFIVNASGDPELADEELVFINPEIIKRTGSEEGQVRRAEEIVVEAFDLSGVGFEMTLDELGARVVQHETDHIDGVLFVDRMTDIARRELDGPLDDLEGYFRRQQEAGKILGDEKLKQQLRDLETK